MIFTSDMVIYVYHLDSNMISTLDLNNENDSYL